jgi:hypothetical protein
MRLCDDALICLFVLPNNEPLFNCESKITKFKVWCTLILKKNTLAVLRLPSTSLRTSRSATATLLPLLPHLHGLNIYIKRFELQNYGRPGGYGCLVAWFLVFTF